MTFASGNCQTTANYLLSLLWIHDVEYPGGLAVTNIKFRVLVWAVSEALLIVVVALNYLPPKAYSWVFKGSMILMALDFVICLIWLPIGAARSYGIRSASEALLTTHNGTGHVAGWNWFLVLIYSTGNSIGWDASGHVAEETIDASRVASRGMFWSCLASSSSAFFATILFLFVTPDIATCASFLLMLCLARPIADLRASLPPDSQGRPSPRRSLLSRCTPSPLASLARPS